MTTTPMPRFALVGAAGFVAPRHMQAIKDVGGQLVAALDPHDSVGILDRYDRETRFFTEEYRFERYLEALYRAGNPIDWLVVCSPNYLHDRHIRMGLHVGAKVLCEKPLVLDPKNLDALTEIEESYIDQPHERRVFTVLQLRHVEKLKALRDVTRVSGSMRGVVRAADAPAGWRTARDSVQLRYITPRGRWYHRSWKGDHEKSGGLITNIGIHMLDMLLWIWGPLVTILPRGFGADRSSDFGVLTLQHADVHFTLGIDGDKPERALIVNDAAIDFTDGFEGLHTTVYRETLAGRGHTIDDARPAIELAAKLR